MAAVQIATTDLTPFAEIDEAKAQAMIDDALALAARVAPCILTAEFVYEDAAKAILRAAILRWNDSGSGAFAGDSVNLGSLGRSQTFDTRQTRKSMFWPSEISELQALCKGEESSGAFSVDTAPPCDHAGHSPWCDLFFGGTTCSCGANLTNYQYPLYEV